MSENFEENERLSLGDYLREKDLTNPQKRFDRAKQKYERLVENFRIDPTESNWMKFEDGAKEFLDASERVYKSSSAYQQNWNLVTRDYEECLELKNNTAFDSTNVGRTAEPLNWLGTQRQLLVLIALLRDAGLLEKGRVPHQKITALLTHKNSPLDVESLSTTWDTISGDSDDLSRRKTKLIQTLSDSQSN